MRSKREKRTKSQILMAIEKYVFAFITLIMLVITGIASRQAILCNKQVDAVALFASEDPRIIIDRLDQKISYTYYYKGDTYIGEDYTSYSKVEDIPQSGEMKVWICSRNPSISCYDKKVDLILISIGLTLVSAIFAIVLFYRSK